MVDGAGIFGVHDHHGVEAGQHGHVLLHLIGVEMRELVDAGVQQEALEAEHAIVVQTAQIVGVAGNRAAPETDVDVRLARCGRALGVECFDVDRRRNRVQRHVDQRGDPARRRCAGSGVEPLPLGATRLVDVHMRIDQAGNHDLLVGEFDDLRAGEATAQRLDRDDATVADTDLAGDDSRRRQRAFAADHQVEFRVARHLGRVGGHR